jgi:acetylornithine aminotransferase
MYLYDTESREYLDFTAGIAVNALGHADEGVAQILAEQSKELVHCSNLFHHFWSGETAKLLVEETKKNGGLGFNASTVQAAREQDITEDVQEAVSSGLKVFFASQ